ncbi:class I SAM-dependent methyltransferase [Candidatus Kaiserbacteria bacterium]|nr:class I SAM-dependent methyltransferase [Candidatus Kaiserbacteria bacterium]
MMFGTRDEFKYIECASCGCVQISEVPADLGRYYPPEYYSFDTTTPQKDSGLKLFLKRQRARYALYKKNPIGFLFIKWYGLPQWYAWLGKRNVGLNSSILDVGCGTGAFLQALAKDGFTNLRGIDPFIEADIAYPSGVRIKKQDLADLTESFDFIMLHHAFEHMADSRAVLKNLYRLIKPGHYVLIRIPVASSEAWEKYRENWVDLDPPRHLIVHTQKSMKILADEVGFETTDVVFDSRGFQFWGSEQYKRDIPLVDPRSYKIDPTHSIFSTEKIAAFEARARELNANQRGDQACFFLQRPI